MAIETKSREALKQFIALLQDIDNRWSSEAWNLFSPDDISGSHRALMHILEAGLVGFFEFDETRPEFRRIVTPGRKLTGDNPDAIYFDAPVHPDYTYRIDGTLNGAVYFSLTVEAGARDGTLASHTVGVLNDTAIDVDADGRFTVYLGGTPQDRNWLPLDAAASRVTTRHYFEQCLPAAGNRDCEPVLKIRCLNPPAHGQPVSDDRIADGITRVCNFLRSRTLGMPPMAQTTPPPFVSLLPNAFPAPVRPGDFGLAAYDAHYSMAPFFINSDEALVITGRWPACRFANVCLWNRFQQTLDYLHHSVSLNRAQTQCEPDGSFRIVIAHQDPGCANWLDTEGHLFGLVFWRYFLAEGTVETPAATVVKFADVHAQSRLHS